MVARRYVLKGRVQGVGFRYFTCREAQRLGVKGWVRNLANGDVEVHAEAGQARLEEFLAVLRSGPSWAVVNQVDVSQAEPGDCRGFSIER